MEYDLFQLQSCIITDKKNIQVCAWSLGDFSQHILKYLWDFFLEIPDEQFNLGHWSLGYSLLKK